MPALAIRQDLCATELRRLARFEPDRRAGMRLLAIANALEGMSRAEAARLAGMERQALRDAVLRYNAEGADGLHDRPRSGRPEALTEGQQAALKAWVLRGPNPERDGVSAWRLAEICAHVEEAYGVRYSEWGMARLLRRLGLSRQKARPRHPQRKGPPGGGPGAWSEQAVQLELVLRLTPWGRRSVMPLTASSRPAWMERPTSGLINATTDRTVAIARRSFVISGRMPATIHGSGTGPSTSWGGKGSGFTQIGMRTQNSLPSGSGRQMMSGM